MHSTPVTLLERLRQPHSASAWDRFVELYSPLLYHWAKKLGLQLADAADLVQDVFVLLWRKLPEFDYQPNKSFHAWLRTVFTNRARQRLRDRFPATADATLSQWLDPALQEAEDREYRQYLVHQALQIVQREFTSQHVQVFQDYVLTDQPVEVVAKKHRLSVGSVYCIKSRIIQRLRQELQQLLD